MANVEKDSQKNSKSKPLFNFLKSNWLLLGLLIYAIIPIDFLPEALLGPLGYVDDVGLLFIELIRRFFVSRGKNKETVEASEFDEEEE